MLKQFEGEIGRSLGLSYFTDQMSFAVKYAGTVFQAALVANEAFFSLTNKPVKAKKIANEVRAAFDSTMREGLNDDSFADSLSRYVESASKVTKTTGFGQLYRYYMDVFSFWANMMEPIRNGLYRTPAETIQMEGRFNLLHYIDADKKATKKTPILIIGSLINRYYILDILPRISIIKEFQRKGFDVYATDWMTPNSIDSEMTLERYSKDYVDNAVEKIKEITGSKKVNLFGYCWGGIFAIIYTSLHKENVKNLVLHATPIDIEKGTETIEKWTKAVSTEEIVDAFGNVPGSFLNTAFLLRNPVEAAIKYSRYFSQPRTVEEIKQFIAIETWLYDSRPIIGPVFREIVDDIYKNNLLIKNKMEVGGNMIDVEKIDVPFLNIVGKKDDLVPPESSKSITEKVASSDKKLIEFPTGHVGLCISTEAHEKLWPEVSKWLDERS